MVGVDYPVLLAFGMSLRAAVSRMFSMSTTYKPNEEMLDCSFPSRGPLNEIQIHILGELYRCGGSGFYCRIASLYYIISYIYVLVGHVLS
jgi:hypothetical protein